MDVCLAMYGAEGWGLEPGVGAATSRGGPGKGAQKQGGGVGGVEPYLTTNASSIAPIRPIIDDRHYMHYVLNIQLTLCWCWCRICSSASLLLGATLSAFALGFAAVSGYSSTCYLYPL